MHGGELLFVDALDQCGETLIVEDVVAPCVSVEGEGCDGLEALDVALLQNLDDAFVPWLVDEVENARLLRHGAGALYAG